MNSSKDYVILEYRAYPNKKQQEIFSQCFGHNRFVHNHFLDLNIRHYEETKKFIFYFDRGEDDGLASLLAQLKKEKGYEWLNDVPSHSLQYTVKNLSDSLGSFKKLGRGFPKFKSRNRHEDSFTLTQNIVDFHIKESEGRIKFPKGIGLVKVKFHRPIIGKPKQIVVKRDKTGCYYVSIKCDISGFLPEQIKAIKNAVGCDLGIKDMMIFSDGEVFENKKFFKKSEKKIKRRQRRLSRKKKGSKNREKARKRLAKAFKKLNNQKTDYIRQSVSSKVKDNDLIVLETLNLLGMLKNHKLAKSLCDVSLGQVIKEFEWQCRKRGKILIFIDQWFPSSQTCSNCGYINKEVKNLKVREWDCPVCGTHHNRDINASINVLHEGLRKAINNGILDFRQIPQELRKFTLTRKGEISKDPSLTNDSCSKDYQSKKPQNL